MIEINLLPSGAARRPAAGSRFKAPSLPIAGADPRVAGLAAAALAVLLLGAFGFWKTGSAQTELQAEIAREQADSVKLAQTIALSQTMSTRQDTVEQKIGIIRSVDQRRYIWPHLMDEISRATPPYTWLTKVAAAEDEAPVAAPTPAAGDTSAAARAAAESARAAAAAAPIGPAFSLEGNTGSTQALTRFMKNLEASPFVRDVALVTSEQVEQEGRNFLKFTLEGRYETPDSSLIQTVPVVSTR